MAPGVMSRSLKKIKSGGHKVFSTHVGLPYTARL